MSFVWLELDLLSEVTMLSSNALSQLLQDLNLTSNIELFGFKQHNINTATKDIQKTNVISFNTTI